MFPLTIVLFLLSAHVMAADISTVDGLSYEDLKQLKPCYPQDTCAGDGSVPDYLAGLYPPTCSCDIDCPSLDTCCIDSPHRGRSPTTHKCGKVDYPEMYFGAHGYYMAQSCPENNVWKPLCEGGLDKEGDILRIAPVSSLDTNTTYKNYYCFRCNERTDNFLYWNLNILADYYGSSPVSNDIKVTYDDIHNTWSATANDKDFSITVSLQFVIPPEARFYPIGCDPLMVTDCPDSWKDNAVRNKCRSYMARLYKTYVPVYRNAHCALCNSQPLEELTCMPPGYMITPQSFSFDRLIDVNRLDDKKKCPDGKMWDPYGKKCRKLSCALPGYVIKNGKCIPP